jgi:Xaa-Pro aminopeptidase
MTRLERLSAKLDEPLLVTSLVNVLYLTGFDSSNAALLVEPDGGATLFTDFRYIELARGIPGVTVELTKRSLLTDLVARLKGTVAFEADALTYAQFERLKRPRLKLVPRSGVVESVRAVKEEAEVNAVRRAALAADRAFEALTAETWVGRSERELAWRLRQLLHAHGVDREAFDFVVAAGVNGSRPHAEPSDAIVPGDTLVTVDWGARVDGYCSDCTRTLATGTRLPKELRRAYDVCLEAQVAAVDGIRPGMTGVEADAIARQIITRAGFGEEFGHGLGHGVGVAVHEAPRLSSESSDVLEPGNVLTIEPGIYIPGLGGVRIEDLAVLREGGVELLTSFPKELGYVS